MRKIYLFFFAIIFIVKTNAQIPTGYYNAAIGKSGIDLKNALHTIVSTGTSVVTYGDMDTNFYKTDILPNGKVWDFYSYKFTSAPAYEFTIDSQACGSSLNYNSEGDCYNKEHLWPQSLFNEWTPMRSDYNHIFPVDGWVNNKRSNYPFGKVTTTTWTSTNGSKLGYGNTYSNYSGLLFEPIDSFKGDIARAMLYMNIRYLGQDNGWQNWAMANGVNLTADALDLLLSWHEFDPVSSKEINRNNTVYKIQKNRNPFIDYPFFVDCIWLQGCTPLAINQMKNNNEIIFKQNLKNISVESSENIENIDIYNTLGQKIFSQKNINNNLWKLDISDFINSFYIIQLKSHSNIKTIKFYY